MSFHKNGIATEVPSQPAIPVFDDSNPLRYWSSDNKLSSVQVAGSGTVMRVNKSENGGNLLQVQVSYK